MPIRYRSLAIVALVLLAGHPSRLLANTDLAETTEQLTQTVLPKLPQPLLPENTDDWRDLASGETLVDVEKDDEGVFLVRGTALIRSERRDLAWCLFRHGEQFDKWIPGIVESELLESAAAWQKVEIAASFMFVSARMTYLRHFYPVTAVTWHMLEGDAKIDDGAWFFGDPATLPVAQKTTTPTALTGFLLHYVSRSRPNIWVPTFVLRIAQKRLLPKQINALRMQLALLEKRYPQPFGSQSSTPCATPLFPE